MFDNELPWRDEHMAKMIEDYTNNASRSVLAILGADHANEIHRSKFLQGMSVGYACVDLSPMVKDVRK